MDTCPATSTSYARRLTDWIIQRSNPTAEITATEVATAIGSRRNASSAIAECVMAGILVRQGDLLFPSVSILELQNQRVGAAGQVAASAHSTPCAKSTLNGMAGSSDPLVQEDTTGPSPVVDLRVVQEQKLLGRRFQNRLSTDSRIHFGDSRIADSADSRIGNLGVFVADSRNGASRVSEQYSSRREEYAEETSDQRDQISETESTNNAPSRTNTPRARSNRNAKGSAKSDLLKASVRQIVHDGKSVTVPLSAEVSRLKVYGMATAYESALGIYLHKPALRYVKGRVAPGEPNFQNWIRAVAVAEALGLEYDVFVKSQFWAFDTWYSRAPKPHELGSTKSEKSALVRAQLFLEEVAAGRVILQRPILSKQRSIVDTTTSRGRRQAAAHTSRNVKFAYAEKQLKAFMANYGATEEQVLRMFCKGRDAGLYFDREWLKQNQTYQRLLAAGEL